MDGADLEQIENGRASLLDVLTPGVIDRRSIRSLGVGPYRARSIAVTSWPRRVPLGFFQSQLQSQTDIDFALHIEPLDMSGAGAEIAQRRTRALTDLADSEKSGSVVGIEERRQALAELSEIARLIVAEQESLARTTLIATRYQRSDDEEDLIATTDRLEDAMMGLGVHTRALDAMQDEGWLTSLPLGINVFSDRKRYYHTLSSGAIAMMMPFTTGDLTHPQGVPLGINLHTGAPFILDLWDPRLQGHNVTLYGATGSGKTVFNRVLSWRTKALGARVAGIDPERDYTRYCRESGGQEVRVGSARLNPFDVVVDQDPDTKELGVHLSTKPTDITALVEVSMRSRLPVTDKSVLEMSVSQIYTERGIYEGVQTLMGADGQPLSMPEMSDLYQACEAHGGSPELLAAVRRMCKGGALGWLDGQTDVDLAKSWVNFDVYDLDASTDARRVGIQLVTMWLWEKFVKGDREHRKVLYVDEAWKLANDEVAMEFLEEMSRRCRKRDTSFVVISQDYHVMAESRHTRVLNQNSAVVVLMRQSPADLDGTGDIPGVQRAFDLSAQEREKLESAKMGEAIIKINNRVDRSEDYWVKTMLMPVEESMLPRQLLSGT